MIWSDDISFEGFFKKVDEWYEDPDHFMGDPAISSQIFKKNEKGES